MKAIIFEKYGPPEVLKLKEIEKPKPNDDQMLVKVYSTAVTPMNYRIRSGNRGRKAPLWPITRFMMGRRPTETILQSDVSGEVVEVGKNITKFKQGDKIFGSALRSNAEFTLCSEKSKILTIPKTINYDEGASVHCTISEQELTYKKDKKF
jgi:NADPH:quinone reductase-like Zn-dependent oxidoreductase